MLLPLIIFIAIACLLLASALIFADSIIVMLIIMAGFLTAAAGLVLYVLKRDPARILHNLVRVYFQHVEHIYHDFGARKSLERQVLELAAFVFNELEVERVVLFARKKMGMAAVESHGIPRDQIKNLRFGTHDDLIETLENRRTIIALDKLYSSGKRNNPFAELSLVEALPILSGGRISHFLALSTSKTFPTRLLRPFLLALADQVSNYHHFEESQQKHNQQLVKLRKQLESLQKQKQQQLPANTLGTKAMIAAQDRLIRIYNREQLYATLMQLFQEQFGIDFVFFLLPNAETQVLELRYSRDLPGEMGKDFTLPLEDRLTQELKNQPRLSRMTILLERLDNHDLLKSLNEFGVRAMVALPDLSGHDTLLGLGRIKIDLSDEELEAIYSHCRLFNLALENIVNFEKIEQMSYTDGMTGLYNYRYFYKRLQEEMLRAKRFDRQLALVIFDIDEFKVFNDTYGHQAGDFLLEQLGALLTKSVRSIDIVSRYGGEEFCVIMPETSTEDCSNFMDRMRSTIQGQEFRDKFSESTHHVAVSLGGAIYPNDAQRIDRLIYCADMALLQAKNTGRNKSCMFDEKLITLKAK